jgi:excisionase family DNA binding protein
MRNHMMHVRLSVALKVGGPVPDWTPEEEAQALALYEAVVLEECEAERLDCPRPRSTAPCTTKNPPWPRHRGWTSRRCPTASAEDDESSVDTATAVGTTQRRRGETSTQALVPSEPLWTVHEVARHLSMSVSWVYKEVEAGRLPCIRLGAAVRFWPDDIRRYLEARRNVLLSRRKEG